MPARAAEMLPPDLKAAKDRVNGKVIDTEGVEITRRVPIVYDGVTYLVEDREEWPLEIMEHLEAGEASGALKLILGAEQYDRWRKGKRFKDVRGMFEAMEKVLGGNS